MVDGQGLGGPSVGEPTGAPAGSPTSSSANAAAKKQLPRGSTHAQLRASEFFGELPAGAIASLANRVTTRSFRAGEAMVEAGQSGESAFLVTRGRFEALADGRTIGEIGRGELVGEMSLLSGEPRTATVVAVRDSEAIEIGAAPFDETLANYPGAYRAITRLAVERLQRVLRNRQEGLAVAVVAVFHDGSDPAATAIAYAVDQLGDDAAIVREVVSDLGELESSRDLVVVVADREDNQLCEWAAGQADRTLLVCDASQSPLTASPLRGARSAELVLVHPATTDVPQGTKRWLDHLNVSRHHHVRVDRPRDVARVIRRLRGQEMVVVCSGGGARGAAHGGLWRALDENGIEVDAVVGVSAGAIASAVMAMGYGPERFDATTLAAFAEQKPPIDFTLPTVALTSGHRISNRFKEIFGPASTIEDMWLDLTVVSSNLTTADIHLHHDGSLWRAVRASTAIPGVFPPVAESVGLLVDGGVVDNLPVDAARTLHPGATIIASDVGRNPELDPADFPSDPAMSGWGAMWNRLDPRNDTRVPGMLRILAQLTAMGNAGQARSLGDIHIEHELDGYGMFDFKRSREILEAGYLCADAVIREWLDSQIEIDLIEADQLDQLA